MRTAREAVASAQRTLASARAAAAQAGEVVTSRPSVSRWRCHDIEVIDAERTARDTDTVVAVAEDAQRRAQLDLLIALGQFPVPTQRGRWLYRSAPRPAAGVALPVPPAGAAPRRAWSALEKIPPLIVAVATTAA